MECPQCGRNVGIRFRFCSDCGQQLRGVLGLRASQKAAIMAIVIAADAISFAYTEGGSLAVGIPVTFFLLFLFLSYPKWAVTLPSDKWV